MKKRFSKNYLGQALEEPGMERQGPSIATGKQEEPLHKDRGIGNGRQ
jgi:hypothetical protein